MISSTGRAFVDGGAFIVLLAKKDRYHDTANELYERLVNDGTPLYTMNHIIDETCTWLLRDKTGGHGAALNFGSFIRMGSTPVTVGDLPERIAESRKILVVYSTPAIEESAWKLFGKYSSAGFTFTDCVSFAVMSALSIKKAFTFDVHFDAMGFERF